MQAATLSYFPAINATLNGTAAVLLVTAKRFIDRRQIEAHKRTMIAAFATSVVFLVCYLYYHAHAGVLHFAGQGWRRPVYFTLLTSHTLLAVVIVPLILTQPEPRPQTPGCQAREDRSADLLAVAVCLGDRRSDLLSALSSLARPEFPTLKFRATQKKPRLPGALAK